MFDLLRRVLAGRVVTTAAISLALLISVTPSQADNKKGTTAGKDDKKTEAKKEEPKKLQLTLNSTSNVVVVVKFKDGANKPFSIQLGSKSKRTVDIDPKTKSVSWQAFPNSESTACDSGTLTLPPNQIDVTKCSRTMDQVDADKKNEDKKRQVSINNKTNVAVTVKFKDAGNTDFAPDIDANRGHVVLIDPKTKSISWQALRKSDSASCDSGTLTIDVVSQIDVRKCEKGAAEQADDAKNAAATFSVANSGTVPVRVAIVDTARNRISDFSNEIAPKGSAKLTVTRDQEKNRDRGLAKNYYVAAYAGRETRQDCFMKEAKPGSTMDVSCDEKWADKYAGTNSGNGWTFTVKNTGKVPIMVDLTGVKGGLGITDDMIMPGQSGVITVKGQPHYASVTVKAYRDAGRNDQCSKKDLADSSRVDIGCDAAKSK